MYEWLTNEIAQVKEPKFHVVDGPADKRLRKAVKTTRLAAPGSYKQFVLELGNCKLYRKDGDIDGYHVEVLASMREVEDLRGERYHCVGSGYFKADLLRGEKESPVFEYFAGPNGGYFLQAGRNFQEWIRARCDRARKKYTKGRWKQVLAGPEPFTEEEQRIVNARKKFKWRVLGIAKNGDLRFEIHNGSDTMIAYYSICIGTPEGPVGGVFLDVSTIKPGKQQSSKRIATRTTSRRTTSSRRTTLPSDQRIEAVTGKSAVARRVPKGVVQKRRSKTTRAAGLQSGLRGADRRVDQPLREGD